MNDANSIFVTMYKKVSILFFALFIVCFAASLWAIRSYEKAQRGFAESNRLVEQYRERDAEAARINRDLAERNKRLEDGLASIRDLAGSAGGNIRQAVAIISGVKSVLETLEDGGAGWNTGSVGGGAGSRVNN